MYVPGVLNQQRKARAAFAFSAATVASVMVLVMATIFPRMVYALGKPSLSLTVANASSSERTLLVMLILALLGMPFVVGYTIWVYKAFAGKAKAEHGY
jgi:cytochrome d ubiquinol oxidase subunit II